MTSLKRQAFHIQFLAVASLAAGCSADISHIASGYVATWKCDKEAGAKDSDVYIPYEYIIQAPGDLIGVAGTGDAKTSVVLNTKDSTQKLPVGWTLDRNFIHQSTDDGGFSISGRVQGLRGDSINQALVLVASTGKMRVQNGSITVNLICKRIGNWKTAISSVQHGPGVVYIERRLSNIPFLRKKVGEPAFTSEIAKESSQNEDYRSVYGLLSPLPTASLSTQEADLVETAKKKLIDSATSSYDVWEWNNSWQGGGDYSDEEKVSRCAALSGSTYDEGFKIVSSTPQDRIAGVNLTCHGTLHLLKKEGALQAEKHADLLPSNYD